MRAHWITVLLSEHFLPDQPDLMHQTNEYLELDKLDIWMKIYLDAIYRLAK